jgi:hypothetical protein
MLNKDFVEFEVSFTCQYKTKIKVSKDIFDKELADSPNLAPEDLDIVQQQVQAIVAPTSENVTEEGFEATDVSLI